jgi:NifU-like protein involved in Fe-S cluster formation
MFDGTVGTSGCDLNIATTSIVAGAIVGVTSFVYTVNKG